MVEDCEDRLIRNFDANQDYLWLWNPSKGKSRGILVGVRKEFYDVCSFKQGDFMLQVNLWDKQNKVKRNLLVVYGAAKEENKINFLSELSQFCSSNLDPILIGGDFNIIRYANERNKNMGVHRHSGLFNTLIHMYELRELIMTGGMFTWSNNQEFPVLEKLDRVLMSKEWEDLFPLAMIKKLPREVSDHNPLILLIVSNAPTKTIQFRFELSWLKNPDFFSQVDRIWNKPCRAKTTIDKIQQKLKLVKQYFKGWGLNLQGTLRKLRMELHEELITLEELEELSTLSSDQWQRKTWVLSEILRLLEEEIYWYNRSHDNWLLHGDLNTKYFHRVASGRKRKNTILSFDHKGITIEGDENLLVHATAYYTDLFGLAPYFNIQINSSIWDGSAHLSESDNELCRLFFESEIWNAFVSDGEK
jgi:hypothetical protein